MVNSKEIFEQVARDVGLTCLYGRIDYIEQAIDQTEVNKTGGLLYVLPVVATAQVQDGLIAYYNYSTTIGVCQQGELSEYYGEKYDLRLSYMITKMQEVLQALAGCHGVVTLTSAKIEEEVNRLSENLDCIICEITYTDE